MDFELDEPTIDSNYDDYYDASEGEADPPQAAPPEDTPMSLLPPPVNEDYYTVGDLISAVQEHVKEQGYAVVRRRSKTTKKGVQNAVYLRCEMGGKRAVFQQHFVA